MKAGYCKRCPKYSICTEICARVKAELSRVVNGRKKKKIELIYFSELLDHPEYAGKKRTGPE